MNPPPVIFDCDGLLVDTHGHWDRAYAALFDRYQAPLRRNDRQRLVGLGLPRLGHELAELLGHAATPQMLAEQIRELVATNTGAGIAPMPGARELVTALAGTRPLAIASNNLVEIVRDYLVATGIPDVFDTIVGAGDAEHPKPAPDLYREAARELGIPCSTIVVLEDSLVGVQSARAAGTTVFAIPDLPQTRSLAHRSFTSLTDPTLWTTLGLGPAASPDDIACPVPKGRHRQIG